MSRKVIKTNKNMDQNDIKYIIEILNDAVLEKDWDKIEDAREALKEFLDNNDSSDDE